MDRMILRGAARRRVCRDFWAQGAMLSKTHLRGSDTVLNDSCRLRIYPILNGIPDNAPCSATKLCSLPALSASSR